MIHLLHLVAFFLKCFAGQHLQNLFGDGWNSSSRSLDTSIQTVHFGTYNPVAGIIPQDAGQRLHRLFVYFGIRIKDADKILWASLRYYLFDPYIAADGCSHIFQKPYDLNGAVSGNAFPYHLFHHIHCSVLRTVVDDADIDFELPKFHHRGKTLPNHLFGVPC